MSLVHHGLQLTKFVKNTTKIAPQTPRYVGQVTTQAPSEQEVQGAWGGGTGTSKLARSSTNVINQSFKRAAVSYFSTRRVYIYVLVDNANGVLWSF